MGIGVDILIKIAETTSQLPGSFLVMPTPSAIIMTIFIFSGLLITLIHHKVRHFGWLGIFFGGICYYFQPIPDVIIAPQAKVVGIRSNDLACFSSLKYFRTMCRMWAQSTGCKNIETFKSKNCSEFTEKIDEDTYIVNIKGRKIAITSGSDEVARSDLFRVFHLNKEKNESAEQIYLPSGEIRKLKKVKRLWLKSF